MTVIWDSPEAVANDIGNVRCICRGKLHCLHILEHLWLKFHWMGSCFNLQEASEDLRGQRWQYCWCWTIEWDRSQVVLIWLIMSHIWHLIHTTWSVHNFIILQIAWGKRSAKSAKTRCRGAGLENWQKSGDTDLLADAIYWQNSVLLYSENWRFPFHFRKKYVVVNYIFQEPCLVQTIRLP